MDFEPKTQAGSAPSQADRPRSLSTAPDSASRPSITDDADADESLDFTAAAAINGDSEALRRLWEQHRRWVAAILLAHKPKWADLEDLLQDVAMALVRKVGEIRDSGALKPWLRTVAINAAHAAARSGKLRPRPADLHEDSRPREGAEPLPPPESLGETQEARRLLELAGQLPDGYREPLLLKAIQGLSYREIGRIMSLPETTVETRIARARRQLRELASGEDAHAATV